MELQPGQHPAELTALAERLGYYYEQLLAANAPELPAALLAAKLVHSDWEEARRSPFFMTVKRNPRSPSDLLSE
jgi:hypothetical protein